MENLEIQIKITQGKLNQLYNQFAKQNEEYNKIPDDVYARLEVAEHYAILPSLIITLSVMFIISIFLVIFHNSDWAMVSVITIFLDLVLFFNWLLFNPKKEFEKIMQKSRNHVLPTLPTNDDTILNEKIVLSAEKIQVEGSQGNYEFLWTDLSFYKANQEYIYFGYFVDKEVKTAYFPSVSMDKYIFAQFKKYCEDIIFKFHYHLISESFYQINLEK